MSGLQKKFEGKDVTTSIQVGRKIWPKFFHPRQNVLGVQIPNLQTFLSLVLGTQFFAPFFDIRNEDFSPHVFLPDYS